MTSRRLFISLFALLLSTGCSIVQTTYNHLDWVISWYVTDYIELDSQQKTLLHALIDQQHRWHRATQLPEYAKWLRAVGHDVKDGFTRSELDRHFLRFEELYRVLLDRTAINAATLLATASERQLNGMFAVMNKHNRQFWDDYIGLPREALQRNRIERMESVFRYWIGPLSERQRTAIEDWSHQRGSIAPALYRYRQLWQSQFRRVLENRQNPSRLRADLRELFAGKRLIYEEYESKRAINIDLMKKLFLRIEQTLTPSQRERLLGKVQSYARDMDELFAQKEARHGPRSFTAHLAALELGSCHQQHRTGHAGKNLQCRASEK